MAEMQQRLPQGELSALGGELTALVGQIGARMDRLPLTWVQWEPVLITALAYLTVLATDGTAAKVYPYVWKPYFGTFEFSVLAAAQVGAGILVGDFVLGHLADRIGRRPVMAISCALAALFTWPLAVTTNFWALLVIVFLSTLGTGGILALHTSYMSEFLHPRYRNRVIQVAQIVESLGFGGLASGTAIFMIPDHYQAWLIMLSAAPVISLILVLWRLPESPRWLETQGRHQEAERVMRRFEDRCERYSGPLPEVKSVAPRTAPAEHKASLKSIGELFSGEYRGRTSLLLAAWILGYSGVVYGWGSYIILIMADRGVSAHEAFSIYFGATLAIGILGKIPVLWLRERVERRDLIGIGGLVFLLGAFGFMFSGTNVPALVASLLVAGLGTNLWYNIMFIFTPTNFPSRLRVTGMTFATAWGIRARSSVHRSSARCSPRRATSAASASMLTSPSSDASSRGWPSSSSA